MMKLLDTNEFIKDKKPVTSTQYLLKSGEYDPDGLFSEEIFGAVGSGERRKTFSFIYLHCDVLHPEMFRILKQLDRRIEYFISTEKNYKVDENGALIEDEEEGTSGINAFKDIFPKISFRGGGDRDKLIKVVRDAYNNNKMFINALPVIPPEIRPMHQGDNGEWIIDELNDMYVSLMRKSFQVRDVGGGVLFDLMNYEMQNAVIKYDNYIRSKLGKKEGAIRGANLGKRVDFSGRGVVSPGPDLRSDQFGIPLRMAAKIFEPFILHVLTKTDVVDKEKLKEEVRDYLGTEVNIESLQKIIKRIRNGDKIPEGLYDIFWKAAESAMHDRVIICKRDPVLHNKSLQGFKPVLVGGDTLQSSTVVNKDFNLDHDGDTMAVYHPLSDEAQEEIKNKMMTIKGPSSSDAISIEISKEMASGLYVLTKTYNPRNSPVEITDEEISNIEDPTIAVKYKGNVTTAGKAIINSCLPENYKFVDELIDKKKANKIISDIAENYSEEQAREAIDCMKNHGFKFCTLFSPTLTIDNLELPSDMYEKRENLVNASPEEAAKILDELQVRLKDYLKGTGFYDLVDSGASKGWQQPMQILVSKGIITDPEGNILEPVKAAFSEGLTPTEYFNASAGARSGIVSRVHKTADSGYQGRKLIYILNDVEADPANRDCKTKRTLTVKLDKDSIERLTGRYYLDSEGKIREFDKEDFNVGDVINLRTPIFCRTRKVCQTCYGKLLKRHQSRFIGILAAQVIGERATQLVMQSFHTGGAVQLTKRDMLSSIIKNDPKADLVKE